MVGNSGREGIFRRRKKRPIGDNCLPLPAAGGPVVHVPVPFYPPDDASSEELRGRVRALADLVARAPVPIAVAHDAECRFISANAALARLLGVAPGELIAAAAALHQLR